MPYLANVYNVLIASPSDVENERKIIVDVIHRWNALHSAKRNIVLMPVMWETHSAPEMGTSAQGVINREVVDECDIAIGVFWSRLGTPTNSADSGTVEEIQRMGAANKLIMLYFSKAKLPYEHDQEQLSKVKEFKNSCYKNGLIESFISIEEFQRKLDSQLEIKLRSFGSPSDDTKKGVTVKTYTESGGKEIVNLIVTKEENKGDAEKEQWKITILKYLFENMDGNSTYVSAMAIVFKMSIQKLQYYLDQLEKDDLIDQSGSYSTGQVHYGSTPNGRSFLIENNYL